MAAIPHIWANASELNFAWHSGHYGPLVTFLLENEIRAQGPLKRQFLGARVLVERARVDDAKARVALMMLLLAVTSPRRALDVAAHQWGERCLPECRMALGPLRFGARFIGCGQYQFYDYGLWGGFRLWNPRLFGCPVGASFRARIEAALVFQVQSWWLYVLGREAWADLWDVLSGMDVDSKAHVWRTRMLDRGRDQREADEEAYKKFGVDPAQTKATSTAPIGSVLDSLNAQRATSALIYGPIGLGLSFPEFVRSEIDENLDREAVAQTTERLFALLNEYERRIPSHYPSSPPVRSCEADYVHPRGARHFPWHDPWYSGQHAEALQRYCSAWSAWSWAEEGALQPGSQSGDADLVDDVVADTLREALMFYADLRLDETLDPVSGWMHTLSNDTARVKADIAALRHMAWGQEDFRGYAPYAKVQGETDWLTLPLSSFTPIPEAGLAAGGSASALVRQGWAEVMVADHQQDSLVGPNGLWDPEVLAEMAVTWGDR